MVELPLPWFIMPLFTPAENLSSVKLSITKRLYFHEWVWNQFTEFLHIRTRFSRMVCHVLLYDNHGLKSLKVWFGNKFWSKGGET